MQSYEVPNMANCAIFKSAKIDGKFQDAITPEQRAQES